MNHHQVIGALKEAAVPSRALDFEIAIARNIDIDRKAPNSHKSAVQTLLGPNGFIRETDNGNEIEFVRLDEKGTVTHRSIYPAALIPRCTESVEVALRQLPKDYHWLMGGGRSVPTEPLYGIIILDPNDREIEVGVGEHEHLPIAIMLAVLDFETRGPRP